MGFTAERNTPVSAASRLDLNLYVVKEHTTIVDAPGGASRWTAVRYAAAAVI
jgi:hypothetical protein